MTKHHEALTMGVEINEGIKRLLNDTGIAQTIKNPSSR